MSQQLTVVQQVCSVVASPEFKAKIKEALPPEISPDRFVRTALTAIQLKPEVCEADRQSLYNSVIQAAQQRLLPDNREGAIVVYNVKTPDGKWVKKAQFQPMVAGIIKRFGEVGILAYAASVYEREIEQDRFKVWNDDTGQHVEHKPIVFGDRGAFVGVFAVARTPDGRTYVETLTIEDIEKVMAASRSKDREGNPVGPWRDWFERMAQKSGLHRLGRRVPITDPTAAQLVAETLEADRPLYDFDGPTPTPPAEQPQQAAQAGPRRPRGLQAVAAAAPDQAAASGPQDAIDGEFVPVDPADDIPGSGDPEADAAHF